MIGFKMHKLFFLNIGCKDFLRLKSNKNTSAAMTLSEIMIVIGIIGIVASITIPIIKNAQEMENISKTKKAYSTIVNATNLLMQDNGGTMAMSMEGTPNLQQISTYYKNLYKQHITSVSECDTTALCEGNLWQAKPNWYYYDGTPISSKAGGFYIMACILGADGITYRFYIYSNNCDYYGKTCGEIMFDINGMKKPNTMGKDIFSLSLRQQKIIPSDDNALREILQK